MLATQGRLGAGRRGTGPAGSPGAIAADGTHVWVTNVGNDSVTELNASDGSWVQTLHW